MSLEEKLNWYREERHRLQQNLAEIRELIGARGRNQDYTMDRLKKIMAVVESIPPETIENRLNCRACFDTENWPCSQCDMHWAVRELGKEYHHPSCFCNTEGCSGGCRT